VLSDSVSRSLDATTIQQSSSSQFDIRLVHQSTTILQARSAFHYGEVKPASSSRQQFWTLCNSKSFGWPHKRRSEQTRIPPWTDTLTDVTHTVCQYFSLDLDEDGYPNPVFDHTDSQSASSSFDLDEHSHPNPVFNHTDSQSASSSLDLDEHGYQIYDCPVCYKRCSFNIDQVWYYCDLRVTCHGCHDSLKPSCSVPKGTHQWYCYFCHLNKPAFSSRQSY
jgi:hypothetical protein